MQGRPSAPSFGSRETGFEMLHSNMTIVSWKLLLTRGILSWSLKIENINWAGNSYLGVIWGVDYEYNISQNNVYLNSVAMATNNIF